MFRKAAQSVRRATIRAAVGTTLVVGTLEVTTNLPSQGRSSEFYHYLADQWITPSMRRFLDPEVAHNIAVSMTLAGLAPQHHPSAAEQRLHVAQTVFGLQFQNPIGLAAGFDKDGVIIQQMLDLGFGFTEIGTVTPLPQPGNPGPRMFRLTQDLGIINRYGFNSQGAAVVEENLRKFHHGEQEDDKGSWSSTLHKLWTTVYGDKHAAGPVGVNIGKNKTSKDAVADYVSSIRQLAKHADYFVLNISSPNTAGLRDLQQVNALKTLVTACRETLTDMKLSTPLLVKLAPDLTDDDLKAIAAVLLETGVDGIVVTNTTNQRPNDLISRHRSERGGLSGAPVRDASTQVIRKLYRHTNGKIPIIGVGGVASGHDAYDKLKAGASLVQVYSMMVYQGPGTVSKVRNELAELLLLHGHRSIQEVVGLDHEDLFWKRRQEAEQEVEEMERTIMVQDVVYEPIEALVEKGK